MTHEKSGERRGLCRRPPCTRIFRPFSRGAGAEVGGGSSFSPGGGCLSRATARPSRSLLRLNAAGLNVVALSGRRRVPGPPCSIASGPYYVRETACSTAAPRSGLFRLLAGGTSRRATAIPEPAFGNRAARFARTGSCPYPVITAGRTRTRPSECLLGDRCAA